MSEERSVDMIRNEYANLCAKAGHIAYSIFTLENDLKALNETMRDLNIEAAQRQAKEAKKE